ncbi:hypothetical protein [Peptoniphilus sp. HCN-40583]|uniref:hypothetical protein n=1 Tax=Peptoniphilus sp. HCN-40583 TaxID=3134662 RepID=UPI0030EEAA4D
MKVNTIDLILRDEMTPDENIDAAIEGLLVQFKHDVLAGDIRIDSVDKFQKVIQSFILMDEYRRRNPNESTESFKLSELIDSEDETVKSLYDKLFNSYNTSNDEVNRGNG